MQSLELIPHLFRSEYSKIVAVLIRHFGLEQVEQAEDITSETFFVAAQTWSLNGVPPNPTAWLYTVAKNKAKNFLKRNNLFTNKIAQELKKNSEASDEMDIDLSPQNISDSQLQMMFAICHPSISQEAQISLSLRILCGFGIDEIAAAFLTNKETINKRLSRAKETLRQEKVRIELPGTSEIKLRLEAALLTIYLLFNEGYYSVSNDTTLRKDLCFEAMRLCNILVENKITDMPEVNALLSLMCFHASRFDARLDKNGELVLYDDQDETLWDQELITKGAWFFHRAATGDRISKYHLEAGIAWWHTQKADTKGKWEHILQLYNQLLQIEYSPIAALNRTYALAKANGKQEAIVEAEKLKLESNHFYFILLGELYSDIDSAKALQYFKKAIELANTQTDKHTIHKRIEKLG